MKKKGISLITLAITILVMAIITTVVVMTTNNSGIIKNSKNTVSVTNLAQIKELANVAWANAQIEGKETIEELTEEVKKSIQSSGIDLAKYTIEVTANGVDVKEKKNVIYQYEEYTHSGIDKTNKGNITWYKILNDVNNGKYATEYKVGNLIDLIMKDGNAITFRVIGINHDDLADGTGKAHMTLLSESTLFKKAFNNVDSLDSWRESEIRQYLNGEYFNNIIPDDVKENIKTVKKQSIGQSMTLVETQDKIWLLGSTEVGFIKTLKDGVTYTYFTDASNRVKNDSWMLRSFFSGGLVEKVGTSGGSSDDTISYEGNIAIGFSI